MTRYDRNYASKKTKERPRLEYLLRFHGVLRETPATAKSGGAVLVAMAARDSRGLWIPKAVIIRWNESAREVVVKRWFAKKENYPDA